VRADLRGLARRLFSRPAGTAIPVADLPRLRPAVRRTRAVRVGLAAGLVAATIAAVVLAPNAAGRRFIPADTVGIVVLDVSSSVRPETYYRIEHELATLAGARQRLALVLFSDTAYEALPTGTPSSELRPLLRFFAPPTSRRERAFSNELPRSPWDQWFSAGTKISNGLFLAADLLERNKVERGAVILISDLADDPTDLGPLTDAVLHFQQSGIPLKIVSLNPTPENAEFFKELLGTDAIFQEADLPTSAEAQGRLTLTGDFSKGLATLAILATLLLTLDAWWGEPLRWRGKAQ
jgi:hypothetical protein